MSDDDQRVIDALMAAQRKNRKIIPCPECERLRAALEEVQAIAGNGAGFYTDRIYQITCEALQTVKGRR